ncbi:MAG TPA: hypothetical protein VII94_03460 [Candidatus Saccharimonadales bacterium]
MISDELYDGVMAVLNAVKKLEAGMPILPRSKEADNLSKAVLVLISTHMIDHSPLTPEEIKYGQKLAKEIAANLERKND